MRAYLTTIGESSGGTLYPLAAAETTRLGRGLDCDVVLDDPLASRVHALLQHRDGAWWVSDANSRNGTYVNGRKIDEAQLGNGCRLKIGAIEFRFSIESADAAEETIETIVRQTRMDPSDTGAAQAVAEADPQWTRLERLYEFSVALVSAEDHEQVIQKSLSLLQEAMHASVVSFWWVDQDGVLKPKSALPAGQPHPRPSQQLTNLVCREASAVWLRQRRGEIEGFASAICAPLIAPAADAPAAAGPLGALHVFAEKHEFSEEQFQFVVNFANVMVRALTRARKQTAIKAAHDRIVQEYAAFDELIGESPPMLELKKRIGRVAKASGCVLVRGESGAGKELIARALHKLSNRSERPMLSVNCAAIPRDLMESQLFGHRKGAFTGAESDHAGFFERADSGTLFLDEVGEMTLEGQAKLLRILEGHPFLPVGGNQEIAVDVRIVAATNRDLQEFVREGRFREDLYYRLSVFELYAPPLRERGGDIRRLLDFFLEHFRQQHGRPELQFSADSLRLLLQYSWPGNVRQLRNVVDSAVVLAEGEWIEPADLGLRGPSAPAEEQRDSPFIDDDSLSIAHWEKKLIIRALEQSDNKVVEAARLLGIGRATLYRKIEEYGVNR